MAADNGGDDVPMLIEHRNARYNRRLALITISVFAVSIVVVVASYFGGSHINWHLINLADTTTATTPIQSITEQHKFKQFFKMFKQDDHPIFLAYKAKADRIIEYLTKGKGKGQAYKKLAYVADTFGHRMTGSKALNDTIDYLLKEMTEEGFDNVHKEAVPDLPNWFRGVETATLLSPKNADMKILGLGGTVGTPEAGLCADVIVVRSFKELDDVKDKVAGKIVVFYQPWVTYPETVAYREGGASAASKYGAVATLIRSVTPRSVYTPHTGFQEYESGITPIPTACLTVEDAAMLWRMQERGDRLKICLKISSHPTGKTTSYNTIGEIRGSEKPDEIVLVSGHLDSWDVGTGAMDDGGGVAIAWQALSTLKALGLRPRRTVRAVFWTAEEQGHLGSAYYYEQHKKMANETYRFVFESDTGAFKPHGLNFSGSAQSRDTMQHVMNLLQPIGANGLYECDDAGDVDYWRKDGVPAGWLETEDRLDYYFMFHHTQADNMVVFEPEDLDYSSVLVAVVAYLTADMETPL